MKKFNKKGFTIVELVIVVAVIAILAAVLIPTFSDLVGNANTSKALQEARNLYTEYVTEFDYGSGGEPKEDVIIEVKPAATGVDGQYVVIKGGQVDKTVYTTKAAAEDVFNIPESEGVAAKEAASAAISGYTNIYEIKY